MISKILVANRGEIACRILHTARAMGFRTVAVFSEADRFASHVKLADQAVCIGSATSKNAYLSSDQILQACAKTNADAIHPGYGFLSENSEFASQCMAAGICFIGPPAAAIELMGNKRIAKLAMLAAGLPCIPGYEESNQQDAALAEAARKIGFPLMVKAAAGGGGRGMRLVTNENELPAQLKTARSEAMNAFGSDELILEKALLHSRHIEIQIFCDQQGNAVYLGERDCSLQRRHQKVIEEAPSPYLNSQLRQRMGEAAIKAALACHYVGAGTVEFLVDEASNFYFLEMNTRLQVEHPVTELVTGYDLVAWQLDIACGHPLPVTQDEIQLSGHAIEARLYAEDPANQFMPQTGNILRWDPPQSEGIRVDSGIVQGQQITPHYDPLLAKIIASGQNRQEAIRRLLKAIQDCTLLGVATNQHFLAGLLKHPDFISGQATTCFIEQQFSNPDCWQTMGETALTHALAAIILFHQTSDQEPPCNWSNTPMAPCPFELKLGKQLLELTVREITDSTAQIRRFLTEQASSTNDEIKPISLGIVAINTCSVTYEYQDVQQRIEYAVSGNRVYLKTADRALCYQDMTHQAPEITEVAGDGQIRAPMDGAIVDIQVSTGQTVKKGDTLAVLEAMKMEQPLKANVDGCIGEINVRLGDQVKMRDLLISVT